jgi:hypothetical protein
MQALFDTDLIYALSLVVIRDKMDNATVLTPIEDTGIF